MKSEDYLKLPPIIENPVLIPFPNELQQMYDDFERDHVIEMFSDVAEEGADISAVSAAALSNKLLQFANGAIYDDDKNWHEVHTLKIDAVKEIIELTDGPVLIAWAYKHDMYRLLEALKKQNPRQLKTSEDIDAWNRGEIKVMLMHPASGGHGLNLQAGGSEIIWFGQTWSLELLQQFNARLYRQGQTKPVRIHKLIATNTVDEDVIKAQVSKSVKQEALMQAVKAKIKKYLG